MMPTHSSSSLVGEGGEGGRGGRGAGVPAGTFSWRRGTFRGRGRRVSRWVRDLRTRSSSTCTTSTAAIINRFKDRRDSRKESHSRFRTARVNLHCQWNGMESEWEIKNSGSRLIYQFIFFFFLKQKIRSPVLVLLRNERSSSVIHTDESQRSSRGRSGPVDIQSSGRKLAASQRYNRSGI